MAPSGRAGAPPGPASRAAPDPRGLRGAAFRLFLFMVILMAVVLVLYEVPIPQSFAGQIDIRGTQSTTYLVSVPNGVSVSGSWSALGSGSVAVAIMGPQGTPVFHGQGNAGSFSFVSSGGSYEFNGSSPVPQLVSVQGSYSATVLQIFNLAGPG